jgi:tagaturonate reductase
VDRSAAATVSAETHDLPRLDGALVRSGALRTRTELAVPDPSLLELPEKAVQFGTGALLRGLVDYFLDEANRRGLFGGRVVAVGSTGSGRDARLNDQDGLYTLVVQGVEQGVARREVRVVASVSRAISAAHEWDAVLACARNPDLELVFSNTTEVGIALDEGTRPSRLRRAPSRASSRASSSSVPARSATRATGGWSCCRAS